MRPRDHVFISDVDWRDHRNLSVHHVVRILCESERVFHVDSVGGFRRLGWRDLGRVGLKLRRMLSGQTGSATAGPREPIIVQPMSIPDPWVTVYWPAMNARLLGSAIHRMVDRHRIQRPVVWTRVASESVWRAISTLEYSALVYYVTGEERLSPRLDRMVRAHIERWDLHFTERADLVCLSAAGLADRRTCARGFVRFFPNGVDLETFRPTIDVAAPIAGIRGPIAGFMGTIGRHIDVDLLKSVADRLPGWAFVLVGPVTDTEVARKLSALPNVTLVGSVPFADIPTYASHFHCGVVPYVVDDFARGIFPCKVAEYLALGVPVISTPLPELVRLTPLVTVVSDPDAAATAIARWSVRADDAIRESLRESSRAFSWRPMVESMRELVERRAEANDLRSSS
jgi:glycosyltransferase involved in cell wall biosynthesis